MQAKAIHDNHCTIKEAMEVANQMSPHFLVLTHFSSRFEKGSFPDIWSSYPQGFGHLHPVVMSNIKHRDSESHLVMDDVNNTNNDYTNNTYELNNNNYDHFDYLRRTIMGYDFMELPLDVEKLNEQCQSVQWPLLLKDLQDRNLID